MIAGMIRQGLHEYNCSADVFHFVKAIALMIFCNFIKDFKKNNN